MYAPLALLAIAITSKLCAIYVIADKIYSETSKQNEIISAKDEEGIVFTRCIQNGTIALTFDDGPNIRNRTEEVLDILKFYNVNATFFVNGENYAHIDNETVRTILRRTKAEGHYIGSHGYTHDNLPSADSESIFQIMNRLSDKLYEILGQRPITMRPPYGEYDKRVLDIVNGELGYKVIMWGIDTWDWQHPGNISASLENYKDKLENAVPEKTPGYIVLHHDTITGGADLAEAAILYVRSLGFKLVPLNECLGLEDSIS